MASFREVDRDSSIQLSKGQSSSGTLQWTIDSNQDSGEYTLRVKSDNDTVDTTVSIYQPAPPTGVSRWTFDDSDTDSGTSTDMWGSNDGTINGATTGVSGANQTYNTGEAYSFDGSDDYVDVPDSFGIFDGSSDLTITGWVSIDSSASGSGVIFSAHGERDMALFGHSTRAANNDEVEWRIFDGSANSVLSSQSYIGSGWVFIGAVWDVDSGMELYIDGGTSPVGSNTYTGTPNSRSETNAIGSRVNQGYRLQGDLDDVRIYNEALSGTEIDNLYNTGNITG